LAAAAQIAAARGLKMKLILENFRKFVNEGEDKVSKKISYLMDKEDKPQDQAVAIALDMEEKGKLEEGFKSGEKVTHDEYGDGVVTHPGTKNTDVVVKFEKDTGRGKSIKVSRGSLKKAVKEAEEDAMYAPMEEGLFSQSMAVQGEIDKHALNLYRVLEALRPADRKEIIDSIINELQAIANEDSISQNDDDSYPEMELEEAATDYHKFIDQGYSQATAHVMASGSPAKKAEYDKLRKQGYGDSEARRFVYGRSYSAMGQR